MSHKVQTTDFFEEHFEKFSKTKLYEQLDKEFAVKPYYLKYQIHYWLSLGGSYFFNVFSALTASTLVLFFLKGMIHPAFVWGLAIVFLLFMESAKRLTLRSFFQDLFQFKKVRYGLLTVIVVLAALSVSFSYFGAKRFILNFTPPPVLTQDSLIQNQNTRLAEIKTEIDTLSLNKDKAGVVFWPSQKAINKLNAERLIIQEEINRLQKRQEGKNDNTEAIHKTETKLKAHHFGLITLCSELFFIFLGAYPRYYRWKSWAQFADLTEEEEEEPSSTDQQTPGDSTGPSSDSDSPKDAQPLKTKEFKIKTAAKSTIHVQPVLDVTKTKKDCRNHYLQSKNASTPETRAKNRDRYLEEKTALELAGHTVVEVSDTSLKIEKR